MRIRPDGSIQPSAFPSQQNLQAAQDDSLYRCMITERTYVGPDNLTLNANNPRVLYSCVILGGLKSGSLLTNVRMSSSLGGVDNFHEIVLNPTTKDLISVPLADHDGDIAFIKFIQGDTGFPIIVALDHGINTQGKVGATPEDGVREKRQFNGVLTETTKTGEYSFARQSGSEVEQRFQPNEGTPAYLEEHLDPEIKRETFKSGLIVERDGIGDKITKTFNGGLSVEEDGAGDKVTITTSGGVTATVDGVLNTVILTAGATTVTIDGTTGMIQLSGAFVNLGAVVSDLVLLATQVITAHNTHVHLAPQAPLGILPTLPPTAPMPPTVFSTTVKTQA